MTFGDLLTCDEILDFLLLELVKDKGGRDDFLVMTIAVLRARHDDRRWKDVTFLIEEGRDKGCFAGTRLTDNDNLGSSPIGVIHVLHTRRDHIHIQLPYI